MRRGAEERLAPLTRLEIIGGVPIGLVPLGLEPPMTASEAARTVDPRRALEQAVTAALRRPPCVVSFSGGRDSSAVLALAVDVARRNGYEEPIPISLRFPNAPRSDETRWQEAAVRHIGVSDWVRIDFEDELDLIGPIARRFLHYNGLAWPPNTHFHRPIIERGRGGSLLTGIDGDGLLGSWRWQRLADVLSRRRRPAPRDLARLATGVAPPRVRRLIDRARPKMTLPWLRRDAMRAVEQAWRIDSAGEPLQWSHWVEWFARRRALHLTLESLDLLASDCDVAVVHPLADPGFMAALAAEGRSFRYQGRTGAMKRLFVELLPEDLLTRPTKASMDEPFWNRHSREFASRWDGSGIDPNLIDADALRAEWLSTTPHAFSSLLLQHVRISTER